MRTLLPAERRALSDSRRLVQDIARTLAELYIELGRVEDGDGSPDLPQDLIGAVSDQVRHLRDRMTVLSRST